MEKAIEYLGSALAWMSFLYVCLGSSYEVKKIIFIGMFALIAIALVMSGGSLWL